VVGSVHSGIRHPHDLFRDPIGFLFVSIARIIDPQLGLQRFSEKLLLLTFAIGSTHPCRPSARARTLQQALGCRHG
jgi:hypothetical protein